MYEPGYRRHGLGDPLGERGDLPLEVDQEGVRPPSFNDIYGAVGDMGLVEVHGTARAQGVGSNIMGVESQALEANFSGGCTKVEDDVGPCNRFWCSPWGYIVCANGSVGRGIVKAQVQVASGGRGEWIPVWHPRGFHGAGFPPNTILLSVEVKCDRGSCQEHLGGSLHGDDAVVIMKLDIAEAELGDAAV